MTTKRKSQTTASEPKNEPKKKRFDNSKKKKFGAADGKKFVKGKFPGKNFRGKDSKPAQPLEKPNWLEIKAKKKTQKIERKKEKFTEEVYELGLRAKQIYEKLKSKRTVNKLELAKELHETLCGKDAYTKLVLSHDIARVVQCLFKASGPDIRADIVNRLKDTTYQMSISKYAHFCVTHMLKYGSKHDREKIVNGMSGNIVKMTTHRFSNTIIDLAYNQYATDEQKALMRQEFYSDMYKKQKDKRITKLADTWTDSQVMKNGILQSTKANILHAATKKLIDNSLLHAVMAEYLAVCSEENRAEVITAYAPILAALPSTKEGSATAVQCFLHAGNKERRAILKALKDHVPKLCVHEHGHLFMLFILNTIDDTVMLKKQVLSVILENVRTIVASEWGRKVIEWIVAPDDTFFFHPSLVQSLAEATKYGKKDMAVRRAEILAAVEKELCKAIAMDGKFWLRGGHTALTTVAILKSVNGEASKKAYASLAQIICDPNWQVCPNESEIIEEDEQPTEEDVPKITPSIVVKNKIKKFDNEEGDSSSDSENEDEDEIEDQQPEKMEAESSGAEESGADDDKPATTSKKVKQKEDPYAEERKLALQKKRDAIDMVAGIEHAGLHIALKKLAKLDQQKNEGDYPTLGSEVAENMNENTFIKWIPLNRACFFLVMLIENGSTEVQEKLKAIVKGSQNLLKRQTHSGAKILLKKL